MSHVRASRAHLGHGVRLFGAAVCCVQGGMTDGWRGMWRHVAVAGRGPYRPSCSCTPRRSPGPAGLPLTLPRSRASRVARPCPGSLVSYQLVTCGQMPHSGIAQDLHIDTGHIEYRHRCICAQSSKGTKGHHQTDPHRSGLWNHLSAVVLVLCCFLFSLFGSQNQSITSAILHICLSVYIRIWRGARVSDSQGSWFNVKQVLIRCCLTVQSGRCSALLA